MNPSTVVYLGIKGNVVALDKTTGQKVWETKLKGANFVNVFYDGDTLFAHTGGSVFCLDAATGKVRWVNDLPGLGYGLATFATTNRISSDQILSVISQKIAQDQKAAQVASTHTAT